MLLDHLRSFVREKNNAFLFESRSGFVPMHERNPQKIQAHSLRTVEDRLFKKFQSLMRVHHIHICLETREKYDRSQVWRAMVQNAVEAAILDSFAACLQYSSKILPVFPTHNISIHYFFRGQELICHIQFILGTKWICS